MGLHNFGIVFTHCGGTNHDVRVTNIFGGVAFSKFNSHPLQPVGDIRLLGVGAGNAETEIDQHLGDSGHADAANADKMYVLNSSEHKLD